MAALKVGKWESGKVGKWERVFPGSGKMGGKVVASRKTAETQIPHHPADGLRRPPTPSQFRNKMTLVVGTMGIMRSREIAAAQSCDYKFDDDFNKGLIPTRRSSTLYTCKRKQDQERKGHQMSFGKSADPRQPPDGPLHG